MRIAICPGSFDPVTRGHVDIVTRAAKLFDKIVIAVSINPQKASSFTIQERVELIDLCTTHIENKEIVMVTELLADYAKRIGAVAIVKGLRAVSDFEYEFQMALANKKLNSEAETIFFTTAIENMYLSSSLVKQIASFGGDISDFVPPQITDIVTKRLLIEK